MTILKKGSRGEEVKRVQTALHLIADGIFGANTEEAVKTYQREHGLEADGIVGKKTWALLEAEGVGLLKRSKRQITEIIVHCSATAEGKDYTVEQIRQWHLQRGFADVGYHYVVYRDGTVVRGRDVDIIGAHCTGHNARSIGVCYVGGCAADGKTPKDTRTQAQKTALRSLVEGLRRMYPGATVHGHYEFANKACPSFKISEL